MQKMSEITKEDLQKLYYEHTAKEAADKLGISTSCLYEYLKQKNIPHKGRGRKRKINIIG